MFAILNIAIRAIVVIVLAALSGIGVYSVLPDQIKLKVPFTSQAPRGVWTEPWQNACEEASIIMINNFYKGDTLTKEKAHQEILSIFDIKERTFGPSDDESMETVAAVINSSNLVWRSRVVNNPTIEDLKTELAAQRPIIVPVYAKVLNNPYYVGEGPDYHVVVLTGYDDATGEFITQDSGTVQGKDFRYKYAEFFNAISDFLENGDYQNGHKRVLFTMPNN